MAWLLRDGDVLAYVEVAEGFRTRLRGLLGRDPGTFDGALLLAPARSVHTIGMRFPIDLAFCDEDFRVIHVHTPLRPYRVTRIRWKARCVLEAEAGAFERWRLQIGDQLELKGADE